MLIYMCRQAKRTDARHVIFNRCPKGHRNGLGLSDLGEADRIGQASGGIPIDELLSERRSSLGIVVVPLPAPWLVGQASVDGNADHCSAGPHLPEVVSHAVRAPQQLSPSARQSFGQAAC